jgi:hypothetical protein
MKYQLCMSDEYGTMSILGSGIDAAALIKRAKDEVQAVNVENALTAGEKERNWEAVYVELLDPTNDEIVEDAYYGGKDNTGAHAVTATSGPTKLLKLAQCDVKVRGFLGKLNGKNWYASDERGRQLNDLKHAGFQGKSFYFLRRID